MSELATTYKFILVGSSGVGKTAILSRLVDNDFSENAQSTVGVEFKAYQLTTDKEEIRLQIWDTAGQERFRSVSRAYFRNSVGAALVFALDDLASFNSLDQWLQDLQQLAKPNAAIILVGNKADLDSERQVTSSQANEYATRHKLDYIETSAKEDTGIQEAFVRLARRIAEKRANGEIQGDFKPGGQKMPVMPQGTKPPDPACNC
jgi:small GTP-binding protein